MAVAEMSRSATRPRFMACACPVPECLASDVDEEEEKYRGEGGEERRLLLKPRSSGRCAKCHRW